MRTYFYYYSLAGVWNAYLRTRRERVGGSRARSARDRDLGDARCDLGALEAEDERVLARVEEGENVTLGHRVLQVLPRGGT